MDGTHFIWDYRDFKWVLSPVDEIKLYSLIIFVALPQLDYFPTNFYSATMIVWARQLTIYTWSYQYLHLKFSSNMYPQLLNVVSRYL